MGTRKYDPEWNAEFGVRRMIAVIEIVVRLAKCLAVIRTEHDDQILAQSRTRFGDEARYGLIDLRDIRSVKSRDVGVDLGRKVVAIHRADSGSSLRQGVHLANR